MRIIQTAVVCGLVMATGACGTGRVTYASARAPTQITELRTLFIGVADLPPGLSIRPRAAWRPPFRARAASCRTVFAAVAGRPPRAGLSGVTAATYEGVHVGELAAIGVAVYEGGDAVVHLEELREAMARCETADGGGLGADRLTSSALPVSAGDEWAARRLTGRVGGYPYEMHVVVARAGQVLVAVAHAGLAPPDQAGTEELARLFARRVGTLDA
ncbi:hypothetical protein [Microbispora sp. NPDC049125]|uniref:hypothetical protein n=1 Tax=Microbispora sp. NPDC049125 TaxID=3154929 RepID=UPI0034671579